MKDESDFESFAPTSAISWTGSARESISFTCLPKVRKKGGKSLMASQNEEKIEKLSVRFPRWQAETPENISMKRWFMSPRAMGR